MLSNFAHGLNTAVIGANGGIGAALTAALRSSDQVARIWALSRSGAGNADDVADRKIVSSQLDLLEPASITAAAAAITEPLDLVFVATGMLRDPERDLRQLDPARLALNFAVNATGPALVAQAFLPKLRTDRRTVFVALSARVGSIGDNRLGGWYAYRASKAALNQLIRTLAIEHARKNPLGVCVGLHPGTVDTPLSKPFQRGVAADKLFTPEYSAARLLEVIGQLTPADSGGLFAWDGARIAP
jgi:NAD(P)-dependent dehydrogenase (short-subunit alcohol dehydrogenase family)